MCVDVSGENPLIGSGRSFDLILHLVTKMVNERSRLICNDGWQGSDGTANVRKKSMITTMATETPSQYEKNQHTAHLNVH